MSLTRQGFLFLLVGGLLVLIDTSVFVLLTSLGVAPVTANVLGRLAGAVSGFWLNGTLTFRVSARALVWSARIFRFALVWSCLTFVSSIAVVWLAGHLGLHGAWLAKPLVEATLALVSFFLSRHWVYR